MAAPPEPLPRAAAAAARRLELFALREVERAARAYARHSHGNLGPRTAYLAREEARDALLDALAQLDAVRGP